MRCLPNAATLAVLVCSVLAGVGVSAQDTKPVATFQDRLDAYRKSILAQQNDLLGRDPKIADFLAAAEQARRFVRPTDSDASQPALIDLHQHFSNRFNELLGSDLGRYVATEEDAVRACLRLKESLDAFSPDAIVERYRRLGNSIEALESYSPTLGDFDPETNPTAEAVVQDASWVNEYVGKLRKQTALLDAFEETAAADSESSGEDAVAALPTLRRAMDAYQARRLREKLDKDTSVVEAATDQADAAIRAADAETIRKRAVVEVEAKRKLAAVARELLAAEAEFSAAETRLETERVRRREQERRDQAKMERTQSDLDAMAAEQDRFDAEERAAAQRRARYLSSGRVQTLLAPFCSDGWHAANTGKGGRVRLRTTAASPMSLSRLADKGALSPDAGGMTTLVRIANDVNDRPGWPVGRDGWRDVPANFRDIDGERVNPYLEAQRILREHGGELVQMGMLRP